MAKGEVHVRIINELCKIKEHLYLLFFYRCDIQHQAELLRQRSRNQWTVKASICLRGLLSTP